MRKISWKEKLTAMREIKRIVKKAKLNYIWTPYHTLIISPNELGDYAICHKTPKQFKISCSGNVETLKIVTNLLVRDEIRRAHRLEKGKLDYPLDDVLYTKILNTLEKELIIEQKYK